MKKGDIVPGQMERRLMVNGKVVWEGVEDVLLQVTEVSPSGNLTLKVLDSRDGRVVQ